jgi:hypothetical protein
VIIVSVALIVLSYLLQCGKVCLAFSSFGFSVCHHRLQQLHHGILGGVAGWWGHLNIEVDDKIRGKFLGFVWFKVLKSSQLENLSSVAGVKTNNTFSFIPNIIHYKANTPLV